MPFTLHICERIDTTSQGEKSILTGSPTWWYQIPVGLGRSPGEMQVDWNPEPSKKTHTSPPQGGNPFPSSLRPGDPHGRKGPTRGCLTHTESPAPFDSRGAGPDVLPSGLRPFAICPSVCFVLLIFCPPSPGLNRFLICLPADTRKLMSTRSSTASVIPPRCSPAHWPSRKNRNSSASVR